MVSLAMVALALVAVQAVLALAMVALAMVAVPFVLAQLAVLGVTLSSQTGPVALLLQPLQIAVGGLAMTTWPWSHIEDHRQLGLAKLAELPVP